MMMVVNKCLLVLLKKKRIKPLSAGLQGLLLGSNNLLVATNRKVAGSGPDPGPGTDEVIDFFNSPNPSIRTRPWGSPNLKHI
jgi:hypothetical protein